MATRKWIPPVSKWLITLKLVGFLFSLSFRRVLKRERQRPPVCRPVSSSVRSDAVELSDWFLPVVWLDTFCSLRRYIISTDGQSKSWSIPSICFVERTERSSRMFSSTGKVSLRSIEVPRLWRSHWSSQWLVEMDRGQQLSSETPVKVNHHQLHFLSYRFLTMVSNY